MVHLLDVSNLFIECSPCSFYFKKSQSPQGGDSQMSQTAKYEIMYIIRPNIEEAAKAAVVERFDTILKDNGAEVIESKDWAKRRLAYEIKDFREGIYHIVKLTATDAAAINEFDRLAKISDDIIRHMVIREEV